ncbi:hypothetical protein CASFOL_027357 [Castilleja foliolosa]|uniref:F-box associated beta-propeller type 3 domain-containing protein n=1 Tax=Castilleja foliolosa TaxID=1961234 RepID=A0ABD3CEM5_9LAMI
MYQKSWNALISDPLFVKNRHRNSKCSNSQDLFICCDHERAFTLIKLEDQKLEIVQELGTPSESESYRCHCHGLVLLADEYSNSYTMWIPSTRTETKIHVGLPTTCGSSGLSYDPITDDVKVVIVFCIDYIFVYSCKYESSSFFRAKPNDGDHGRFEEKKGVCVDGAIYWVWSYHNVKYLIYFDPRDNQFKFLQKPKDAKQSKMFFMADLGGFLCLRCEGQENETTVKIWIKEKGIDNNSWNYLIAIDNIANVKMDIQSFEPQCFVGDKIVIRNKYDDKLVVYSLLDKTFEQLEGMELKCCASGLIPYLQDKTSLKRP